MAIPTTGSIALVSCPGSVACSSISGVVCGSAQGVSLLDMGAKIGMTGSIFMTNFHGSILGDLYICPATISSIPAAGGVVNTYAWSVTPNTFSVTDACTWITPYAPEAPSTTYPGSIQGITVASNTGAARSGVVCYTPSHCGTVQCVTLCQLAQVTKCVDLLCVTCAGQNTQIAYATSCMCANPSMSTGEYYCACVYWNMVQPCCVCGTDSMWCILRNGSCVTGRTIQGLVNQAVFCNGYYPLCVAYGDVICLCTRARVKLNNIMESGESWLCEWSIYASSGGYQKGTTRTLQYSMTCGLA
jgi:hypothetical protein